MCDALALSPSAEAVRMIESGRFRILSLDIFDTAVWRTFPTPSDLFYALGHRLLKQGFLFPSSTAASFAFERVEAEKNARARLGKNGEVTLDEIYECFPSGYLRTRNTIDVMEEELALEFWSTFTDPEIASLIDYAKGRGLQIAFVSDTYFDDNHLLAILRRDPKYLLTSCAYRRCKAQGLHEELLRLSGEGPSAILHVGDNHDADAVAPARLGVRTLWRPRIPRPFHDAFRMELPSGRTDRAAFFGRPAGDGGLTAMRMQSVMRPENSSDPYRTWGSFVLGPVMSGFGRWVGERCKAENIGTALCLMREGKILKRVLDGCETGVEAHEFYTSRYALIRASIFCGETEELMRFLARPSPAEARDILAPLDLDPVECGLLPDELVPAHAAFDLAQRISNTPELRHKAQLASARARRNFLKYLHSVFPELPERVAVVDLGYSGTIQACLQLIFDHEGIPCRTHGLYFVTGSGIRKVQSTGGSAEGFLAENGQPLSIAHSFMRSPELVEQCLMCNLGSTVGYDDEGQPILGQQHLPDRQLAEIDRVQAGMMDFVTRFAAAEPLKALDSAALRPFLEAILVRSLTSPCAEELKSFGEWVHDENFGSANTRSLIGTDLDAQYLRHASAHQLASLSNASSYWIFGTAHDQHPVLGEAVKSIFLRKAAAEAFQCPEDLRRMYFFWNDGQTHRADSTYALSSRRTAWSRFTLEVRGSDLFEVGFSLGRPGDVVSIGGMVLRLHEAGKQIASIQLPLSGLQTFGVEPLKGTTAAFLVTDAPGFVSPVSAVRGFTGRVEVDLLFSQLPTGEMEPIHV